MPHDSVWGEYFRGVAMRAVYLLRHGHQENDHLTDEGKDEVRLSAKKFLADWNKKDTIGGWHSPAERCVESALIFARVTGIPSGRYNLLRETTYYDEGAQRLFAAVVHKLDIDIALIIGHDENRRHVEMIVRHEFGVTDKSPRLPQGGLLRYTKDGGYVIL